MLYLDVIHEHVNCKLLLIKNVLKPILFYCLTFKYRQRKRAASQGKVTHANYGHITEKQKENCFYDSKSSIVYLSTSDFNL